MSAPSQMGSHRVGAAPRLVRSACLLVFLVGCARAAIEPHYPRAFGLEMLPLLAALPFFGWLWLHDKLSDRAWLQLTAFLLLHLYGAHSTYANTEVGFWLRDALGLSRNHYDRIVHFSFGLLMVRPLCELLPQPSLGRELLVALAFVGAMSVAYEQIEWITAVLSDPTAGVAFLGAQGDEWDAQKDVSCATLGSLVAAVVEWRLRQRSPAGLTVTSRPSSRSGRRAPCRRRFLRRR